MKPLNVNALRETAQRRLTCAPLDCQCEADCFKLAQALLQLLPDPLLDDPLPDDPDLIEYYGPEWGTL